MADQYTQQDPTTQYPQPNFGEQQVEHPGLEPEMQPKPDYGYETYRGHYLANDPVGFAFANRVLARHNASHLLDRIRCPTIPK